MAAPDQEDPMDDQDVPNSVGEIVEYYYDAYGDFVDKLYRKHPGEWFALAIEHEDDKTGHVLARIIAHHEIESLVTCALIEYHRQHPGAHVAHFFTGEADLRFLRSR